MTSAKYEHLDPKFGNGGVTWIDHTGVPRGFLKGITVAPDNKLIVTGDAGSEFFIARFEEDGTRDTSFKNYGFTTGKFRVGFNSSGGSACVLKNGELLVSGVYVEQEFGPTLRGLALLDTHGEPVMTFGENGGAVIHPATLSAQALTQDEQGSKEASAGQPATASIELPDGKFMVLSNHKYSFSDAIGILMRVDRQGKIDYTFGGQKGYVPIQYTAHFTFAGTFIQLSNGNFAIGGLVSKDVGNHGFIAVFSPDGVPEATFGDKGYVVLDSLGGKDEIFALLETPDGHIVGIGSAFVADKHQGLVVCLDRTGSFVKGFNDGKPVITPAPDASKGLQWLSSALRPDGKIVALGSTLMSERSEIIIKQLLPNGNPDEGFDESGQKIVRLSEVLDLGKAVALQREQLVVAGTSLPHPEGLRSFVFRCLK